VESGALLVRALLERVPTLTLLVTSRQRLGISSEQEFALLPLPTPRTSDFGFWILDFGLPAKAPAGRTPLSDGEPPQPPDRLKALADPVQNQKSKIQNPEVLLQFPSVQLFMDRARAVRPDFQLTPENVTAVGELCDRLEGLPLALELAAARAAVLSPAQMLARVAQRVTFLVGRQPATPAARRTLRARTRRRPPAPPP